MPTTAIKREEKHSKKTGQHQPQPPRGGETPQSTQKPQSAKKQHHNQGRKRTPQGGQKSQTAKTQTPTTTTRTKATAQTEQKPQSGKQKNIYHNHQKKNTPGRVEATGAPKNKYQKQQPASKDNCQPTKKRETQQRGHHQHLKKWQKLQSAERPHQPTPPTTTGNKHQLPWTKARKSFTQRQRQRPNSVLNAKSNQMLRCSKRSTVTLAPARGRGWGVLVVSTPQGPPHPMKSTQHGTIKR